MDPDQDAQEDDEIENYNDIKKKDVRVRGRNLPRSMPVGQSPQ